MRKKPTKMRPQGMMTENDDPWKQLSPPQNVLQVTGRRADKTLRWDIFWAVDVDRSCLLIFRHTRGLKPKKRLPRLRGLELERRAPDDDPSEMLVLRLVEREQREIFHRLCSDIIAATKRASTEEEALELFLGRTWRWHRLLRGGRDSRLSDEEQKGLLGELRILSGLLFPTIGVRSAIRSWTGPDDAPKDFEIGRICIEAKARRGAATPYVAISTEHQLATQGVDALFLHVSEITGASENDAGATSIIEIAKDVRQRVEAADMMSLDMFDEKLAAVGLDLEDDYSGSLWLIGTSHLYEVVEGFPRITPELYPTGVSNVRYSISLPECEPFRTDESTVRRLISDRADD
jgi:hypothetical protein